MDILGNIELTIKRNILKWHAGHDITCRGCGTILDCRRAVELDIYKGDTLAASKIVCSTCYDTRLKDTLASDLGKHDLRLDITDGRELFGRPRKATKGDN